MNKFAAFAVLALAALAVSVSSSPLDVVNPLEGEEMTKAVFKSDDTEEVAELKPKGLEVFEDFCLTSRDYVLSDIKGVTDGLTSKVYNMIFSSAAQIAIEGLDVQKLATERLAAQLANPESAIEGGDSDVDQIIADGQTQIQGQSQPRSLLTAVKSAANAVSTRVGSLVKQRIDFMTSMAQPAQVFNVLSSGCEKIQEYETAIRNQLETYKQGHEDLVSYKLEQVPCATAQKILRSEGVCRLFRVAVDPVKKIFGFQ